MNATGAKWQAAEASGVQSLVWRYRWEKTHSDSLKQILLAYNQDDCQAVRLLTAELKEIGKRAASRTDVDYAYTLYTPPLSPNSMLCRSLNS
jgi:hypothetical protein